MRLFAASAALSVLLFALPSGILSQAAAAPAQISADLGPCSALLTVTGTDGKPVYGAKVTTRVHYGLMGVKKLDLEAFTGPDGKLKIAKLPNSLKKPMFILVTKDDKSDQVEFKPTEHCNATFDVHLH